MLVNNDENTIMFTVLPKNCAACPFYETFCQNEWCNALKKPIFEKDKDGRLKDCPIIKAVNCVDCRNLIPGQFADTCRKKNFNVVESGAYKACKHKVL